VLQYRVLQYRVLLVGVEEAHTGKYIPNYNTIRGELQKILGVFTAASSVNRPLTKTIPCHVTNTDVI